ncbi:MAG: T9SS type A sorting domain-containing protein, partial [Bacteroidota bacterium]
APSANPYYAFFVHFSEDGGWLSTVTSSLRTAGDLTDEVIRSEDGHYYWLADQEIGITLGRIAPDGTLLSSKNITTYNGPGWDWNEFRLISLPGGGIAVNIVEDYTEDNLIDGFNRIQVQRFDDNFDLLSTSEVSLINYNTEGVINTAGHTSSQSTLNENNEIVAFSTISFDSEINGQTITTHRRYLTTISLDGTILSNEVTEVNSSEKIEDFGQTNDGKYFFCGRKTLSAVMVKMDETGRSITNCVKGNIFYDINADCNQQPTEQNLSGWVVKAVQNNFIAYGITDDLGNYKLSLEEGTYELTACPPANYWDFCENDLLINVVASDILEQDFAAQASTECPNMWVDFSVPLLRRCFDNTYHVRYCNYGTITEPEASILISLDPGINLVSAELPYTTLPNGDIEFLLGEVPPNACDQFRFEANIDCENVELGQTLCATARIFPDTICTSNPEWSGASIQVTGNCENEELINFTIRNVGDAPTTDGLNYIVVEDQVIMSQEPFSLNPLESLEVPITASGATYRIAAQQEPQHPGNSQPSFTIEGCGGLSPGFVNMFSMDDGNDFVDIDCKEVIGSFDPNDKTGFPLGRQAENFIEENIDLEYLIRFQNTGTDTAFRVVIRDTLSRFLDPTTVQPGASSHPYQFELLGNGILKFTFDNILLPDSTTNLEGSNGFVEFKIKQQIDNPIGTVIRNTAAIYFDFNAPIITNETIHTIGEVLVTDVRDLDNNQIATSVSVYPNPFLSNTTFDLHDRPFRQGRIELFNLVGQLIRSESFEHSTFNLERKQLQAGTYPFIIYLDEEATLSGKLIVF